MKRLCVVSSITALLLVASASLASAQDTAKGQELFTAQRCNLCHSIAGKGNAKGPLDDVGSKLKADEIRMWIDDAKGMTEKTKPERKPAMRQYSLPKADVDALVAYLSTLKK